MSMFPDDFGAPFTTVVSMDTNDVGLWSRDGVIVPVAPGAMRGSALVTANTGSTYTATRTAFDEDFLLTVTANTTITLAGGGIAGEVTVWNIVFVNNSTGGFTIAVSGVVWVGGTPTFVTTPAVSNHCMFVQHGTGTIFGYYGGAVGVGGALLLQAADYLLLESGDLLLTESGTAAKLTALSAMTTPTDDDLIYVVNDPAGTPASNKLTMANLKAYLVGS